MAEHPIQGLMNVTMEKIHQMVDSNTIIGKPITTEDGITNQPKSKVSFGFASGGTDFNGKNAANKDLFGGGSGAGATFSRWHFWSSRMAVCAPSSCRIAPTASTVPCPCCPSWWKSSLLWSKRTIRHPQRSLRQSNPLHKLSRNRRPSGLRFI